MTKTDNIIVCTIIAGLLALLFVALRVIYVAEKLNNQCDATCHPYKVTTSALDYCLCAGNNTVKWRKDIK